MKRFFPAVLFGLILAGALAWFFIPSRKESQPETKPVTTEKPSSGLNLSQEQQKAAGIAFAKPARAELEPEIKAYGRVLDASGLATAVAEFAAAQATFSASSKEFERQKQIGEDGAAKALEAAEAAQGRDRAAVDLVRAKLWANWGPDLCARADLAELSRSILLQQSALVRVDMNASELLKGKPGKVSVTSSSGGKQWEAEFVGSASAADLQAQGAAFFLLIRGSPPLPGTLVFARLRGQGQTQGGFRLPRTAVLQYEGKTWIYGHEGEEKFERKPVEVWRWEADSVLVVGNLDSEMEIVVSGAQQLLSEEMRTSNTPE